jgi:hypothetical protein
MSTAGQLKVAALLCLGVLASCQPDPEFPIEPILSYKEFTQHGDSASLVVTFTDGDGDIGLNDNDTFPPYDTLPYYYNFFLEYYQMTNGVWPDEPEQFALPLYYRVPVITPTGQNKTLEGEIAVALAPWPTIPGSEGDTIRLSARLVDRALHVSNTVHSDAIIVQ